VEAVAVIKLINTKTILMNSKWTIILLFFSISLFSQNENLNYKKKVLESSEVEFLSSYYNQDGSHSVIGGGIGTEKLNDETASIVLSTPLSADAVLTIDVGISAYTSASSSNTNPFSSTGASKGGGDDDDDDDRGSEGHGSGSITPPTGTPWQASSGASKSDELIYMNASYSHSSKSRNFIWNAHGSVSNEYDYTSFGFGAGISQLFNKKNTEISLSGSVYMDTWRPIYPTELHEFELYGRNFLNQGFFSGVTVLDQNGNATNTYLPSQFSSYPIINRNSYALTLGFSQILFKKLQIALSADILAQEGLLSTPYHRIYFSDKPQYFIGNANSIANYTSPQNKNVFRLADDVERLPSTRFKIPIGVRLNYYLNEIFTLRTFYRYYSDDWGITSQTVNFELPIKLNRSFTIAPMYRLYNQTQATYFAPYNQHVSTETYYTSDYDLAAFHSTQIGGSISYSDMFTTFKIGSFGLKNIDLRYNRYNRSDLLTANIVSFSMKFIGN